jgi:RNA polymerase sigma-70 factor, ECF subfamily
VLKYRHRGVVRVATREENLLALKVDDRLDDDAIAVVAARAGDPRAKEGLVRRWTDPVYRFSYRMLLNEADARDATQDTLVKVLRNLEQYDTTRPFSTWVFGIARNTCIDEHRRRGRRSWEEPGDVPDLAPSPLQEATQAERAGHITRALAELPPMYREVLVMYHFEHLKYVEIADVLGVPLGTVMNRIFRARQRMRELYESQGGER